MTLTKQQDQLITAAAGIMTDPATMQDSAFLARQLVQCTLPHKNPGNVEIWTRREGKAWLMVLYWTITEAVRLRSRTLPLGHSLNDYLRKVGLNPATGGGKRGDAARVRGQSLKLFNASISFGRVAQDENGHEGKMRANMEVTSRSKLWWNVKTPEQRSLWESEIILGEDFYNAVTAAPVPLDYRALRALKRSALGLDLYAWLALAAYRASTTGKAVWISWRLLGKALGAEYDRADNFQQKAKRELRKIRAVFPGLRLGQRRGGLEVLPTSSPPVLPRLGDVENQAK
jgi:Plasmid encoded RepA protein